MTSIIVLVIAAAAGACMVLGAAVAAFRLIPRPPTPENVKALRGDVVDLQRQFLDFQDKYELSVTRNTAKVGKLRRKVARLQDEEYDGDDDLDAPTHAPAVPAAQPARPLSKAELFAIADGSKGIVS